jgi:two-component system phosphate regulon sensor histidine kinase PhoR
VHSIQNSSCFFREVIEALPQLVWVMNKQGHVAYFNRRWPEYTGLTYREFKKNGWQTAVHPDDLIKAKDASIGAMPTQKSFEIELRLRHKDGSYYWHLARTIAIADERGETLQWVGTATEIENQKKTANSLHSEKEMIERFMITVAHDLRTPLTSIKMGAEYLLQVHRKDKALQSMHSRMIREVNHADEMIRNLLDIHRIRAGGQLYLKKSYFCLNTLIESIRDQVLMLYRSRVTFESTETIEGYWDYGAIRRVMENLTENAVKYGDPHSPIVLELKAKDQQVELSVHNQGLAMNKQDQAILFQEFFRTESALESGKKGWGIGLHIVKNIVEAHGGSVTVKSNEGEGTTFSVSLPLSQTQ